MSRSIPLGRYAPRPRTTGKPSAPLLGPSTGPGRPRKPPTLALLAEHYLAGGVDYALGRYARYWRDNFGELTLDELTPTWFRAWRREAQEHWAGATCRQAENTLSGLFRLARETGWQATNPVRVCGLSQPRNCRYKALSPEEAERLLAACEGDLRDVATFGLQTGLRIGELLSVEWEHLGQDGRLFVPAMKTAHSRTIPLTEAARAVLEARRGHPDRPFPFAYRHVAERFKRACKRAGVQATLHSLRHSFATNLVARGAPIYAVSALMGHRSVEITQKRYAKLGFEQMQGAVELLERAPAAEPDLAGLVLSLSRQVAALTSRLAAREVLHG